MKTPILNRFAGHFAFIILTLFSTGSVLRAAEKPLNVLLITADDLNENLGCYGHPMVKSPNLDRLAAMGMRFNHNYCQFSLCGPSRNSMLSGLYPDQIQCHNLPDLFRNRFPDAVSLPQYFMNHGYISARVGKIFHYGNPSDIGTDGVDDPASWNERYNPKGRDKDLEAQKKIETLTGKGALGAQLSWYADPTGTPEEHTDGMVASQAIELLNKYAQGDKPFFLGVGFYKPHTPFVAPKKYFDLYDKASIQIPQIPENYADTLPKAALASIKGHPGEWDISDSQARNAIQGYYAVISFLDEQVGRVLNELERLGLRDNTIILFTSDNGYHLGEHRHWQKMTLFRDAARTPLLIYYPGMPNAGKASDSLVEMIDFYPTLCELAGLPPPPSVAGVSLVPVCKNPSTSVRTSALTQFRENGYSITTGHYRFSRWGSKAADMELYDLENDPGEMNNLAQQPDKYPELIKTLNIELQKRIDESNVIPAGLTPAKSSGKKKKPSQKETDEGGG